MKRSDVLVIGGGLIGCATAWRLAAAGARVTLIEAGDINAGASGQNAGSLHFQIERRFIEHGDALADQAARIVVLNRLAVDDWRGIEAELGADLHVAMNGGLMVAETPADVALLEAKARREAAEGLDSRLIDGDEARRIAPYLAPHILAACHAPDEGHANPRALTPALVAAARQSGAEIVTHAPVRSIDKAASGFTVRTEAESYAADRILVACGVWTQHVCALANLHMPLFPVALLMNATERTAPAVPHLIQHAGRRLSMKQAHAGNILIGGGWPSRMRQRAEGGFDLSARPEILEASLAGNLRAAIDTVPMVARLNLIRSWTGMTAVSADQLPIAGEVPRLPGFYVAGGGSAFTLGLTIARLLAEAMTGGRAEPLDILSPARFEHLNGFMG
ncbi:NAD(P)/FAD-dependent oxidoreductase [Allosphingosinicella indica]|uniref:Glycine/D-amino acid oxidase n=1 Tax=Allosphingosinicella indica TaxID=941907 RepID=A0A1X7G0N2_9SPHN|nr:FAD-dependent oxidoreductase [Allosphingosinicella indica]SMF61904.1 Glycine/D-amino acid oxidase [Allosphingosinicella indica]